MFNFFNLIKENNLEGIRDELKKLQSLSEKGSIELLSQKNDIGETLLHAAVKKGSIEIIQEFIVAGVPLNEYDANNKTSLHLAVEKKSMAIVEELVAWGVSFTAVDKEGKTPLQVAEEIGAKKIAALLSTREEWQGFAKGFSFNRVVDMILKVFPAVEPAHGEAKVFLISDTGEGKSTLGNYLCGTEYEIKYTCTGKPYAHRKGGAKEVAKTGQGMSSQTLFPQVIKKEGLNYVYCDLAGFNDNRGAEERICAASGTHILSRLPGGIKTILVVLSLPSFIAGKGALFKEVAASFANMVQQNPDLMDSIYFIITKPSIPNIKPSGIIEDYIEPLLNELTKKKSHMGLDNKELALLFMLNQMKKNDGARILIPDITDNGASRKMIEAKISASPIIDGKRFNFLSHDGVQNSFNYVLLNIAKGYLDRKYQIEQRLPRFIEDEEKKQANLLIEIKELQEEIEGIQKKLDEKTNFSNSNDDIEEKRKKIKANKIKIKEKETDINIWNQNKGAAKGKLDVLDTNEMMYVTTEKPKIEGAPREFQMNFVSPFALDRIQPSYRGWGHLSHEYIQPRLTGETGIDPRDGKRVNYYIPDGASRAGKYEAIFRASKGLSSVEVVFFTQKRDMHISEIKKFREEIGDFNRKILSANVDIGKLEKENTNLDLKIQYYEKTKVQEETWAERTVSLNKELQRCRSDFEELTNLYNESVRLVDQYNLQIQNNQTELVVNQNLFEIVCKVSYILDLQDSKIIDFQNSYLKDMPDSKCHSIEAKKDFFVVPTENCIGEICYQSATVSTHVVSDPKPLLLMYGHAPVESRIVAKQDNNQSVILCGTYEQDTHYDQNTSNSSHFFDAGDWDNVIHQHPETREPVFIYRVYKDGREVGSASFYKHPLLCRSEDGERHNIIASTGIFSDLKVETRSLESVCAALPPTMFDKVVTSAVRGGEHGAVRGVANVIGYTLQARNVSAETAYYIQQAVCYGGYFLLRFNEYMAQVEQPDFRNTLDATLRATADTGTMFMTSVVADQFCRAAHRLGEYAQESGWTNTGKVLRFFGDMGRYGVYAYDASQRGILEVGASVVTGGVTQSVVEGVGKKVVNWGLK